MPRKATQPANKRPAGTLQPSIDLKKRKLVKSPAWEVPEDLLESVRLYCGFYTEAKGEEATADEIVTALLDKALGEDAGFQRWRKAKGEQRVGAASPQGAVAGGPDGRPGEADGREPHAKIGEKSEGRTASKT